METDMGTIACELKYSGAAERLIAGVAAASLALLALLPLSIALRVAIAACVASMAIEALQRVARHRGPLGVRSLAVSGAGEIVVWTAQGERREGRLRDGSFVAPWLTIVCWRACAQRPERAQRFDPMDRLDRAQRFNPIERLDRTVLILPDMLDRESFRRLRVRLRWG
jgi:toxin CptA